MIRNKAELKSAHVCGLLLSVFNGETLELEVLDSQCEPDATERNG